MNALPVTITPSVSGVAPEAFRLDGCAEPLTDGRYRIKLSNRRPLSIRFHVEGIPDAGDARSDWPSLGQIVGSSLDKLNTLLGVSGFDGAMIEGGAKFEFTTAGSFRTTAEVDNQSIVWTVLLIAAAEVEGGWEALSKVAAAGNVATDTANLDWPSLTNFTLGKVLEIVKISAASSGKASLKTVAALATTFLSGGGVTMRTIGETLDFTNANAIVAFDSPPVRDRKTTIWPVLRVRVCSSIRRATCPV